MKSPIPAEFKDPENTALWIGIRFSSVMSGRATNPL